MFFFAALPKYLLFDLTYSDSSLILKSNQIILALIITCMLLISIFILNRLISKIKSKKIMGIDIQNGKIHLENESITIYKIEKLYNPIPIHNIKINTVKQITINSMLNEHSYIIKSNEDLIRVVFTKKQDLEEFNHLLESKLPPLEVTKQIN